MNNKLRLKLIAYNKADPPIYRNADSYKCMDITDCGFDAYLESELLGRPLGRHCIKLPVQLGLLRVPGHLSL